MIFVIGFIVLVLGIIVALVVANPRSHTMSTSEWLAVGTMVIGLVVMVTSLCILAWRALP